MPDLDPQIFDTLKQEILSATDDPALRARQFQHNEDTNRRLAYMVTGAFFLLIVLLLFVGDRFTTQEGVRNLLFTLLGVVATGWTTIISYYFGSSSGSSQKTQTLATMLEKHK
jgi:uncharacterized membrane-anchored protein